MGRSQPVPLAIALKNKKSSAVPVGMLQRCLPQKKNPRARTIGRCVSKCITTVVGISGIDLIRADSATCARLRLCVPVAGRGAVRAAQCPARARACARTYVRHL